MTAEEIIRKIRMDAEAQAASILKNAEEQAAMMERQVREQAELSLKKRCEEAARQAGMQADHIRSISRMEARKIRNGAKARAIHKAISIARKNFSVLVNAPEYREVLERLLRAALEEMGSKEGIVLCHPRDRGLMESLASADSNHALRVEPAPDGTIISGGLVLASEDGRIRVDQRLEERLRRMEADLVQEIATILFPTGES
ncbi:MAG: V-type ATP synthase subunit E family protein [Methanomicrobiales archaeon]|nr:V-type ATP synthase subunit E family protein [Methanomicrobiales archaeon]